MYDAVYVLAHALQQVDTSTRLRLVNLSCEGDQAWAFGSSLYNYLNLVSISGSCDFITALSHLKRRPIKPIDPRDTACFCHFPLIGFYHTNKFVSISALFYFIPGFGSSALITSIRDKGF